MYSLHTIRYIKKLEALLRSCINNWTLSSVEYHTDITDLRGAPERRYGYRHFTMAKVQKVEKEKGKT